MRPPPLLMGAALLFWGWRVDMIAVGAIAGGLLELSHSVKGRWEFTDKEFNRLWDVCTVLFVCLAAYLRFSEEITSAAYRFFQWMPLVFYPMAIGLAYSVRDGVPLKAFSWFMRRRGAVGGERPIAFGWVYFVICLVTAGSNNVRDIWYFIGFTLLSGVALWFARPRRVPEWIWVTLFLVIATAGFYGQARLPDLQAYAEMKISELFVKFGRREFDPAQSKTSMGRIGSLKQSSRIVMKVAAEAGAVPERLRQTTYRKLDGVTWRARQQFEPVPVEQDITTWTFRTNIHSPSTLRLIERVDRKSALLSLPLGTTQLQELPVGSVETNGFLTVKTSENPGLLDYLAHFGPTSFDRAPDEIDREIPADEVKAIGQIAAELDVDSLPAAQKLHRIVNYFEENFRYTTFQKARELGLHAETPLSEFLIKTRAGHCEYFASATVLLLRHFKIPARYATGYAVQEHSKDGDFYIVRERHAHAWALAFVNDNWVEVDSTPSGWDQAETEDAPASQGLKDRWERFTFAFMEWRWLGEWGIIRMIAPWLAVPLIAYLAWRIFGRRMRNRSGRPRDLREWPGGDSEFFELERRLARSGLARGNEETNEEWSERVAASAPGVGSLLGMILRLHFKYRFHPEGLNPAERTELRKLVRDCIPRL